MNTQSKESHEFFQPRIIHMRRRPIII